MNITVHRGLNEIGGTCVELEHNACRIILDLGIPLTKTGGEEQDAAALAQPSFENGILPVIDGLYANEKPKVNAVLLSHAHLDHYGLMDFINEDIPVYMSADSKAIIETGNIFWRKNMRQVKLLPHCRIFNYWTPFEIGPFRITPFLIDHSGYGSSAFLIESGGKKVFYTGDFRGHGNKQKTFLNLLKEDRLKGVDVLITEGTTLGNGHNESLRSETHVKAQITTILISHQDVAFNMCSVSNIDMFVSIFNAAKIAGKEIVTDLYQHYLLTTLKQRYPQSGLPPFNDDHIRIFYTQSQAKSLVSAYGSSELLYKYKSKKIDRDEIVKNRKNLLIRLSMYEMSKLAGKMQQEGPLNNALFIYSMWHGYLNKQKSFMEFTNRYNMKLKEIHTSGHAFKKDIMKLINSIKPKMILPVHTLNADFFKKEFQNINIITDKYTHI
jgi:ribonuclease J